MSEYNYKEIANRYDEQIKEYNSYGHGVLFGMSYQYVKPNEKILDLGIWTGLASIQFSKVGLKVYGLDILQDKLNICREKAFGEELKRHDLSDNKLPYNDNSFNHIICCAVFHFLSDLGNIFSEVVRKMKQGGIFAFTISPGNQTEDYIKEMNSWGVPIYKHSSNYIIRLLHDNGWNYWKNRDC